MLETRPLGSPGRRAKPGNALGDIGRSQAAAVDDSSLELSCAHSATRSLMASGAALCRTTARPGPASGPGAVDERSSETQRIAYGL